MEDLIFRNVEVLSSKGELQSTPELKEIWNIG
jgi:hypothetical protein